MTLNIHPVPTDKAPMDLLLEADPSRDKVRGYLADSYCYVAETSGEPVGVYVLRPVNQSTLELMNIAVAPGHRACGIGTKLLHHAISSARHFGAKRLEVGTGTFGYQLAFYQKAGFRAYTIERDFFLKNYAEPVVEAGIRHKDMLRMAIDL